MASISGPFVPGAPMLEVLAAYPQSIVSARWVPLGSAGGFSGARLWRGLAADGREFALKAHGPGTSATRLASAIHPWMTMARQAGLDFVPAVERTRERTTVVNLGQRAWDITTWMPGQADFHVSRTEAKLLSAVNALARLHDAWARESSTGICPAILRRSTALNDWQALIASGWQPRFDRNDPIQPHADAAWSMLPHALKRASVILAPWLNVAVALQPCLCDIWHDHVIFDGDRVTGLIDFAAAKIDHVAVDLARLLGSLIPNEPGRYTSALRTYGSQRSLSYPDLVEALDATGVVVGITNWLRWLYREHRVYADRAAVAARLGALVGRLRIAV